MRYFVTPTDEKRLKLWEKVFGRTQLPVKYSQPHIACTQRWGDVPVYYLDTTAVPDALLDRLAAYESRRMGISYAEARLAVRREWLIRADECLVEQYLHSGQPPVQPAFSFLQQVPVLPNFGKLNLQRAAS